jgi:hypothetical protein
LANVKKIFSETAWPNGAKLGRKQSKHVKFGGIQIVLTNFCQDENNMYPPSNHYIIVLGLWCLWPPRAILVSDWLMLKKSSLKLPGQMEPNLAGSIYVRSSIKLLHLVPLSLIVFEIKNEK